MTAAQRSAHDDLDNLRHMLGVRSHIPRRQWGYRNFFAASETQIAQMERLVAAGYARKGIVSGSLTYYHVTEAGCHAIGLHKAAIKRAFE